MKLGGRGTEPEEKVIKRLAKTHAEIPFARKYDYIVFNHDGRAEETAENIFSIVKAEKLAARRIPDIEEIYFGN